MRTHLHFYSHLHEPLRRHQPLHQHQAQHQVQIQHPALYRTLNINGRYLPFVIEKIRYQASSNQTYRWLISGYQPNTSTQHDNAPELSLMDYIVDQITLHRRTWPIVGILSRIHQQIYPYPHLRLIIEPRFITLRRVKIQGVYHELTVQQLIQECFAVGDYSEPVVYTFHSPFTIRQYIIQPTNVYDALQRIFLRYGLCFYFKPECPTQLVITDKRQHPYFFHYLNIDYRQPDSHQIIPADRIMPLHRSMPPHQIMAPHQAIPTHRIMAPHQIMPSHRTMPLHHRHCKEGKRSTTRRNNPVFNDGFLDCFVGRRYACPPHNDESWYHPNTRRRTCRPHIAHIAWITHQYKQHPDPSVIAVDAVLPNAPSLQNTSSVGILRAAHSLAGSHACTWQNRHTQQAIQVTSLVQYPEDGDTLPVILGQIPMMASQHDEIRYYGQSPKQTASLTFNQEGISMSVPTWLAHTQNLNVTVGQSFTLNAKQMSFRYRSIRFTAHLGLTLNHGIQIRENQIKLQGKRLHFN